ncbi:hypothetical protein ACH5RR_004352 [Cinchona calisaya]|uniref:Uncharacterized protein n=1 Tax=Cinchona calisaya TaxID=153742 RepID=A0ABD3AXG7_9GENT
MESSLFTKIKQSPPLLVIPFFNQVFSHRERKRDWQLAFPTAKGGGKKVLFVHTAIMVMMMPTIAQSNSLLSLSCFPHSLFGYCIPCSWFFLPLSLLPIYGHAGYFLVL